MTSKRCFINYMREDMRHRVWMLALSVLGNFLALPVTFLLVVGGNVSMAQGYRLPYMAHSVSGYLRGNIVIAPGIIAFIGALIVGIGGFRYLFHKNMVDTYESIPVTKNVRFLAIWLNGFLIWLIPFVISYASAVALAIHRYRELQSLYGIYRGELLQMSTIEWLSNGALACESLAGLCIMIIAFLVVYNMTILAVMVSGNVLNTLLNGAAIGAGAIMIYGLVMVMATFFFDTFSPEGMLRLDIAALGSPLAAAGLLWLQFSLPEIVESGWILLVGNIVLAIGLFAIDLYAYNIRRSEIAGQGTKHPVVRYLVQTIITCIATMGGWLVLYEVAKDISGDEFALGWAIFGALLCGVFIYGVTDIIFSMDFKAFFKHKILMAVTVFASMLVCFAINLDWIGYDTYLPKESDIAEIAINSYEFSNRTYNYSQERGINEMHITDAKAARAFLEKAVECVQDEESYSNRMWFNTKITLKSGRVVYREYSLDIRGKESTLALVTNPEFYEVNYTIPQEFVNAVNRIEFIRNDMDSKGIKDKAAAQALMQKLKNAYNADLEKNPEGVIFPKRTFCRIHIMADEVADCELMVSEEMINTIQVLKEAGYGSYVESKDAMTQQAIKLSLDLGDWYEIESSAREGIEVLLEEYFGEVDFSNNEILNQYSEKQLLQKLADGELDMVIPVYNPQMNELVLTITDKADMQKIYDQAEYEYRYHVWDFDWRDGTSETYFRVQTVDRDGIESDIYLTDNEVIRKYLIGFKVFDMMMDEYGQLQRLYNK